MPSETKCQRQDRMVEEFVDYFTSGFSTSGTASSDEEHVSSHTGLWNTSLSEAEIAQRCAPEQGHPLPC